jgi:hypothetical protein
MCWSRLPLGSHRDLRVQSLLTKRNVFFCLVGLAVGAAVLVWLFLDRIINTLDPPPGGMKLPPGYYHHTGRGIDSRVGSIWKPGGAEIEYDIGPYGEYRLSAKENLKDYYWVREEDVDGQKMMVGLHKSGRLAVTFDEDYYNFSATVRSDAEIEEVLTILRTFRSQK